MSEMMYTKATSSNVLHRTADKEVTICGRSCSQWSSYPEDHEWGASYGDFLHWSKCKQGCFDEERLAEEMVSEVELIDADSELDEETLEVVELQGEVKEDDSDGGVIPAYGVKV